MNVHGPWSTLSMQVLSKYTHAVNSHYAIWSEGGQWKLYTCMWERLRQHVQTSWNSICASMELSKPVGGSKNLPAYRPIMLFVLPRLSKSLWRSVLTSLIVKAASVTTTHCVAGVLWRTSVLGGPSVRMQWSQWDGCRTPASASQPQSLPTSLSWMTQRVLVWIACLHC